MKTQNIIFTAIILSSVSGRSFGVLQNNTEQNDFNEKTAIIHIQELEKSILQIEGEARELDSIFQEKNDYFYSTRQEIQSLANNMTTTVNNLKKDIKLLHTYKKEIQTLTEKLTTINEQHKSAKEKVQTMTHIIYQLHNEIYEDGKMSELKLFLKNDDISNLTSQELYINALIDSLKTMLDQLIEEKKEYSQMLETIYEKKRDMENNLKNYQEEIEELEQKEIYLHDFIKLYKENKIELNQKIENLLQNRKEIEAQIRKIISAINQNRYEPEKRDWWTKKEELHSLKARGTEENFIMSRPTLPITEIKYYFGDKAYEEKYNQTHNGIQIASSQGTPLHAPLDGIVIKAINNYDIGINWLLVAHKDKITTAYLYLNNIIVKEGDIIRQGQVLGYTGGEPGTRGSGIISKGPNLTFMIAKGEHFIDPLLVLDLSVINNINTIPESLSMKYHRDIQKMDIDVTSTTFIEGDTLKERRSTFLKTYAQGTYRMASIWEQAGEEHYIDPIVVSCIVFAETTLGKHFASDHNPGNVGNPDDPNVRTDFTSPIAGIQAIYDTLDNKALHNRYTLDELSGFGELNKGLPLYATSNFNRQNNIQRCLTSIYGFYAPKNFPFRTGPILRISNSFEASKAKLGNR